MPFLGLDNTANFAKVTVSTGYGVPDTSIVLSAGQGALLPTVGSSLGFNLVWWDSTTFVDPADDPNKEIVRVTNISTDTLTVVRAQEGTIATTKNTGGHTYKMANCLTSKVMNTDLVTPVAFQQLNTLVNGANQNISLAGMFPGLNGQFTVFINTGPTGAFSLGGFTNGVSGRRLTLLNLVNQAWTLNHLDGGSTSANQIFLPAGANFSPFHNISTVEFIYGNGHWNALVPGLT